MNPRALLERVRRLDARRLDLLVAVVVGVELQIEASFVPRHQLTVHLLMLLMVPALALRRRFPLATFVLAMVPFVAVQALGSAVTDHLFLALFAVIFMCYSVAANAEGRRFWLAPPIAFGSGLLAALLDDYDEAVLGDIIWLTLVFVAGPMVTGRLLRNRSQLQRALRDKASRLDRERELQAARAVAEERSRIAGDLHDIVAHALTDMTVQATAAGRLAGRDPDLAREAFTSVEGRGREALGELRRLLGVLRHEDEEIALAPQPSLRHLEALVRRAAASGLPVTVEISGAEVELPAGIDVTGYRVVQEALTRALRDHAAGRADVRVRYARETVEVEVGDDGFLDPGDGPPLGLRERVALYGGELSVASREGGGHLLRARLPRELAA